MNQVTLVLPFALPAPELATDLIRAMRSPALAALLTRTCAQQFFDFDNSTRVLPHEAWLAHALGLGPAPANLEAGAGFAPAAMRGFGLDPADGTWFLVHPVHVQISRNHLLMGDPRQLALDDSESRALFEAAKPYFDEIGKPLLYGDAHTWFARADDWSALRTASPDAATSQNLNAWMPEGPSALASRKLQNEVQMLWYSHPVNEARQARGATAVNSFWLWGGAQAAPTQAAPTQAAPTQAAPTSSPRLFTAEVPPWLAALADPARRAASAPAVIASGDDALVVLGGLTGAGLNSDWSVWLMHLQMLEREWFEPLLAALKDGRVGRVRLVLSHRDAYAEFTSTRGTQRKFWRKPTLNKLIK